MVEHTTVVGGLLPHGMVQSPTVLQRTDQEFIANLLDEMAGDDGVSIATAKRASARNKDGVLKLFQPVHRTFHIALVEAACDFNGQLPRLDAERIESAGLVVRRVAIDDSGRPLSPEVLEGWMQAGKFLRGWVKLANKRQLDSDPDPARRRAELNAGHPEINRLLAPFGNSLEPLAETSAPLFVVPPEVCAKARRTILYGLVPVTSTEVSEAPATDSVPAYNKNDDAIRTHLSGFLRSGINTPFADLAARQISFTDTAAPRLDLLDPQLNSFMTLLRQLTFEFDVFGATSEAKNLYDELDSIKLRFPVDASNPSAIVVEAEPDFDFHVTYRPGTMGDFLKEAKDVLIEGQGKTDNPPRTIQMPLFWPAIDPAQGERILDAVTAAMSARLAEIRPREGRFDDAARQYRLRAFVRVKRADGCPPEIIWSAASEPFVIAPWFEGAGVPPVQVALPNPFDKDLLKSVKPNVAFAVPKDLFNFMQANDAKKLVDGDGNDGKPGLALDWICSFSIPFITICAFIVLNIFLQLFNIVFQWMMFIKICLPFPKRSNG